MPERRILVHGHRGCRAVRPENSIAAFDHALRAGVDVLEMDLAVTADDIVVVSHDLLLNPVIIRDREGKRIPEGIAIRWLSYSELSRYDCGAVRHPDFPRQVPVPGSRIPTLDEILRMAAPSRVEFNIETKISGTRPELAPAPDRYVALVLQLLQKHRLEARTILQSFDFRPLLAMKRLHPQMRLAALDETGKFDFVTLARQAQAQIVSPRWDLVTPSKVAAAHAAGLQVVPWTANEPAQWQPLIGAGVDGIITDDPDALLAYLRARGLR
jgi:glycerophosphoryl diester phosphodiesterase